MTDTPPSPEPLPITTPCLQCHDPAPTERIEGICTACMKVPM